MAIGQEILSEIEKRSFERKGENKKKKMKI
jgi:hypothetical protein